MLDASGIRDENEVLGNRRPDPGCYHFVVTHVDDSMQKQVNAIVVTMQVLQGVVADAGPIGPQIGRELSHMMFHDDQGQYTDKHLRFAVATRLLQPGTAADVDWQQAVGLQCVATVESVVSKKDGKAYCNIADYGLAIWHPLNPEVKNIPKDQESLKLLGNSGNATNSPPSDPQPGGSDWSKVI